MYVKPSASNPAALRKARYEREQSAKVVARLQANKEAHARLVAATIFVSTPECGE